MQDRNDKIVSMLFINNVSSQHSFFAETAWTSLFLNSKMSLKHQNEYQHQSESQIQNKVISNMFYSCILNMKGKT